MLAAVVAWLRGDDDGADDGVLARLRRWWMGR